MGADLITIALVHPNGPVTEKECRDGIDYLKNLHSAALEAKITGNVRTGSPLDKVIQGLKNTNYIEDDMETGDIIDMIRAHTENPERLIGIFTAGFVRDLSCRVWKKHHFYYAGGMSWGDEPDGWGYQSLKWIELLGADWALGLE